MAHEVLIDGDPVPRTIDPRPASAWLVRAGDACSLTIGAADLDAETVAELGAREHGVREVAVEPLHAGMLVLADDQPDWAQFMVFGDVRVNRKGNYMATDGTWRWQAGQDGPDHAGPDHAGGEIQPGAEGPGEPVTAWRVQWPDGRSWLMIYPSAEADSERVRAFLTSQHDADFILGRIDTGTFLLDPASPAPAGYKALTRPVPAAAPAMAH